MLNIRVICVGKSKEKYWDAACAEYLKRLKGYCNPEVIEVKEARLPANASPADEKKVIEAEGREILARTGNGDHVIALDIRKSSHSLKNISKMPEQILHILIRVIGNVREGTESCDIDKCVAVELSYIHRLRLHLLFQKPVP